MANICVVKFSAVDTHQVTLVPEDCMQSSKNVKIKIGGNYLFAHKTSRQLRARGMLLFTGKTNGTIKRLKSSA